MSSVCQQFSDWAQQAAKEWDGGNNADLMEILADKLGISLMELVQEGQNRVASRVQELVVTCMAEREHLATARGKLASIHVRASYDERIKGLDDAMDAVAGKDRSRAL